MIGKCHKCQRAKVACMTLTCFWGLFTSTNSRVGNIWRRWHFCETQTYLKRYIPSSPRFSLPALPADQWQSSSHAAGSRHAPYIGSFSALPSPSAEKVVTQNTGNVLSATVRTGYLNKVRFNSVALIRKVAIGCARRRCKSPVTSSQFAYF